MIRDFGKNKLAFISVILMATLCLATFTGLTGVWTGMENMKSEYLGNTNSSEDDYIVTFSRYNANYEENLKSSDYVTNVESRDILNIKMPEYKAENITNDLITNLKIYIVDDNTLREPKVINGEDWGAGGLWVDNDFYQTNNLNDGDKINIEYQNRETGEIPISGSIMVPENSMYLATPFDIIADHKNYAYGYCTETFANNNFGNVLVAKEIVLTAEKDVSEEKVIEEINKIVGAKNIQSIKNLGNTAGLKWFDDKINQVKVYSIFFPILFLLISLITLKSTMKRLVIDQKIVIGTFSALGISEKVIILHYLIYGIVCSGLGSIFGNIIGPKFVAPALMNTLKTQVTMPEWIVGFSINFILVGLFLIVVSSLFVYTECRKVFHSSPATIIRNKSNEIKKIPFFEDMINKKWISFNIKWILRDIFRNYTRSLMAIFGAMGCVILLITGLGLYNSINYSINRTYNEDYEYYHKFLVQSSITDTDKKYFENLLEDDSPAWLEQGEIKLYSDSGDSKHTIFSIISDDKNINLQDQNETSIDFQNLNDDEIVISKNLARDLKVNEGDTISFRINSSDLLVKDVKVVGITKLSFPIGIFANEKFNLEKEGKNNFSTFLLSSKLSDDMYSTITSDNKVLKDFQRENQYKESEDILKSIITIVILLVFIGIFLGFCILINYNLLIFINRYKEFATLKVIGKLDSEITFLSFISNAILTVIGCILGVPLGLFLLDFYVNVASPSNQAYISNFNSNKILLVVVAVIIISAVVNAVLNIRIKKIDMVESLKSIE
ncbi:FtsX-like permease family protein [Clostridium paraputrificum]|uniref:ABC transporter permease n=1 Tax=Clostridium paraputrificum TaxID=29363 RepID=UPI003D3262D1